MPKFAVGQHAWGISDRSGFRYRLNEMRVEWNGLKVGPDEFEPKHPQLEPRRKVIDGQALRKPRPDVAEVLSVYVGVPNIEQDTFRPTVAFGQVGGVTVVTT